MNLMEAIIAAKLWGGGGGGGSVTAAAVLSAMQDMSDAQAALALAAIGGEPEKLTVTITKTGNQYSADKTYSQISAALTAGKIVEAVYGNKVAVCIGNVVGSIQFVLIESYNNYSLTDGFKITFFDVESNDSMLVGEISYSPITVDAALSGSSTNPVQNKVINDALALKADATSLNNKADKPTTVTDLSSTSITLASAADNTEYNYGELSALTISSIPASGWFSVVFDSGSTPTVLTVPNTMIMPDSFAVEANTRYEINCKDGYALVAGWAVS